MEKQIYQLSCQCDERRNKILFENHNFSVIEQTVMPDELVIVVPKVAM
jgi:hypothetical protein